METHNIMSLLNACGVIHIIAHFGKILITITDSVMRSPGSCAPKCYQNFIRSRRVTDRKL